MHCCAYIDQVIRPMMLPLRMPLKQFEIGDLVLCFFQVICSFSYQFISLIQTSLQDSLLAMEIMTFFLFKTKLLLFIYSGCVKMINSLQADKVEIGWIKWRLHIMKLGILLFLYSPILVASFPFAHAHTPWFRCDTQK